MPVETEKPPRRPAILRAPATSLLAASWVIVFGLLVIARGGPIQLPTLLYRGFITPEISHGFGDVTPLGLYGGQLWRSLTATFLHFNLLHLILNLLGFVLLGRSVESWYGSGVFLMLYAVLGGGANLLANLLRPWVAGPSTLVQHSGGGSTVVLGLIGLVVVVSWRNRAEFPKRAPYWLAAMLLINAGLGQLVPNIDNLGHAAGAAVGGLVGLMDARLIRLERSRAAIALGVIGLGLIIGSGAAQMRHRQAEQSAMATLDQAETLVGNLAQVDLLYHLLAIQAQDPSASQIEPKAPNLLRLPPLQLPVDQEVIGVLRTALLVAIRQLDAGPGDLNRPPTADAYRSIRILGTRALFKSPTQEELAAFEAEFPALSRPAWAALIAARQERDRLRYPAPRIAQEALNQLARRSAQRQAGVAAAPAGPSAPQQTPIANESAPETP